MNKYLKPIVLGIDQDVPRSHLPLAQRLQDYGSNTGNFIFSEALYQVVEGCHRASYHYSPKEIRNADVAVVAAANWINAHSDFGKFSERLKSLGLPVVLVGIGLQVDRSHPRPRVTLGTRKLLDLAAESSGFISVRGEQTKQALEDWGYPGVVATGCPSLLLTGGEFIAHSARPEPTPENVVLMGTRHFSNRAADEQNAIYQLAFKTGTDLVFQSELADMYFCVNIAREEPESSAISALKECYKATEPDIIRYLERHGRVFFEAASWRSYLAGKEYVIGTRIHGIIAAILSGKRGFLLSHDARTAEMADIMGIPTAPLEEFGRLRFEDLSEIVRSADFDLTRRRFPEYKARFQEFFALAGLPFCSPARGFGL